MLRDWIPIWTIPTLMVFAIGTVWLRLAIVRTTYSIHQVNQNINKARQECEQLQLKVAALRSPRRLEALARMRYGLSQPKVEQVVHFSAAEMTSDGP